MNSAPYTKRCRFKSRTRPHPCRWRFSAQRRLDRSRGQWLWEPHRGNHRACGLRMRCVRSSNIFMALIDGKGGGWPVLTVAMEDLRRKGMRSCLSLFDWVLVTLKDMGLDLFPLLFLFFCFIYLFYFWFNFCFLIYKLHVMKWFFATLLKKLHSQSACHENADLTSSSPINNKVKIDSILHKKWPNWDKKKIWKPIWDDYADRKSVV